MNPRVVLSFTTFKARVNCLSTVLTRIANQVVKPDEVRCYTELQLADFPENIQALLAAANVQLFPAEQQEKGYKKILPVLKDFWGQDVIIIVIDDDWGYPLTLVRDLLAEHNKHPNAIISYRGRRIIKGRPYKGWPFNKGTVRRPHETMIHSGSGSLFMPLFFKETVFDDDYKTLAPTADDLWLTVQAIMARTPVVTLSSSSHQGAGGVAVPLDSRLYTINIRQNDIQWAKLVAYAKRKGVDVYGLINKSG